MEAGGRQEQPRAARFYLLDLEKRCSFPPLSPRGDGPLCRPFEDGAEWARKHLPDLKRPDKLILLARRLEKLPRIEATFHSGEIPWTKLREIARIADANSEEVWLNAARRLTCRELEEEVTGKKSGDRPGGGLKARRTTYKEEFRFPPEGKAIWDLAIQKRRPIFPPVSPL